jgi:hypothetical protein
MFQDFLLNIVLGLNYAGKLNMDKHDLVHMPNFKFNND